MVRGCKKSRTPGAWVSHQGTALRGSRSVLRRLIESEGELLPDRNFRPGPRRGFTMNRKNPRPLGRGYSILSPSRLNSKTKLARNELRECECAETKSQENKVRLACVIRHRGHAGAALRGQRNPPLCGYCHRQNSGNAIGTIAMPRTAPRNASAPCASSRKKSATNSGPRHHLKPVARLRARRPVSSSTRSACKSSRATPARHPTGTGRSRPWTARTMTTRHCGAA
jgi:hypothetical protein